LEEITRSFGEKLCPARFPESFVQLKTECKTRGTFSRIFIHFLHLDLTENVRSHPRLDFQPFWETAGNRAYSHPCMLKWVGIVRCSGQWSVVKEVENHIVWARYMKHMPQAQADDIHEARTLYHMQWFSTHELRRVGFKWKKESYLTGIYNWNRLTLGLLCAFLY